MLLELLFFAIYLILGFVSGWILGTLQSKEAWRSEMIRRGYAEYVLVNGGPETKFQWKEKP